MNPSQDPDQLEILLLTTEELQRQLKDLQDSTLGKELGTFQRHVLILQDLNRKLVWRQTTHQMALLFVALIVSIAGMWWVNEDWKDQTYKELLGKARVEGIA